jgi:hypothetical protein
MGSPEHRLAAFLGADGALAVEFGHGNNCVAPWNAL